MGLGIFLPWALRSSSLQATEAALWEDILTDVNTTGGNYYARKRSGGCYRNDLFQNCCCQEPDVDRCWSRGRNFVRCCSGSLGRCSGSRRPQLHVIAYGRLSEATMTLAHSTLRSLGAPLLLFGRHRDHEPLPYEAHDMSTALIRKLLFTKELLEVLPKEDYVMYLDATDTLIQRGSQGDAISTYSAIAERHASTLGLPSGRLREPVVFAGTNLCHPFQTWSESAAEEFDFYAQMPRTKIWKDQFQRAYGHSGIGPLFQSGAQVCERINSTGAFSFIDSGAWMSRVAGARHLFGMAMGVAQAEKCSHCMEVLGLTHAWFPGFAAVDTEAELFWSVDLQVGIKTKVTPEHPAVVAIEEATERSLCRLWDDTKMPKAINYWHQRTSKPPSLKRTGTTPLALHFVGSSKFQVGNLCWACYHLTFIFDDHDWALYDLDAKRTVHLHESMLGGRTRADTGT